MRKNLIVELTKHAKEQIIERKLELKWIAEAIYNPIHSEADRRNPELTCTYGRVFDSVEQKERVLKVVYNKNTRPWKIVTCYFDRTAKRRFLC